MRVQVVLLGAGASKAAGYPLAGELLPAIKEMAHDTRLVNLASAWAPWESWAEADLALRAAMIVRIHGYSLPASDTGVRALLNQLRSRLERDRVEVHVSVPDREGRDRWRDFLGPGALIDDSRIE